VVARLLSQDFEERRVIQNNQENLEYAKSLCDDRGVCENDEAWGE